MTYDNIVEFIKNISFRFAECIISHPDYEQTDYISALRLCEDNDLTEVVKHLLLHRPLFEIEQSEYDEVILHPYVYVLLAKYKQPLIYTELESNEYTQHVIEYFNHHSELDHVQEAITLLGDMENV